MQTDTLPQQFLRQVNAHPDRPVIIFCDEQVEQHITYRELHGEAQLCHDCLHHSGVQPGELICLALGDIRSTIYAFWGALLLGAVPAVTALPVEASELSTYLTSLKARVERLGIRAVIAEPLFQPAFSQALEPVGCKVLSGEGMPDNSEPPADLPPLPADPLAVAYVQFSSGTTGEPRGIAITHCMALGYIQDYWIQQQCTTDTVWVNWLPMYHDMGLVATMMVPVCCGGLTVLIPPITWLRKPVILFEAIHRHGGKLILMPNFAFSYCVRMIRPEDMQGIDLSSAARITSGGETIYPETFQEFIEAFAAYGVSATQIAGGYGFAEAVLAAASSPAGTGIRMDWIDRALLQSDGRAVPVDPGSPTARGVVSSGSAYPHVELRIVGSEGQTMAEREVGEIYAHTPWLFSGVYLGDSTRTNVLRDGWFPTGDIGYITDGYLYVLGRIKDLIIVGGRNIHPADIEAVVNGVPGIRPGRCVAFGMADTRIGTDSIVLVCEVKGNPSGDERRLIALDIRRKVREALGLVVGDVHLAEKGWVRKTTSGKMPRSANREKYLADIASRRQDTEIGDLETRLIRLWEDVLGVHPIQPTDNFFALGGTSMLAVTLLVRMEQEFRHRLPIGALLTAGTVAEFAEILRGTQEIANTSLVPLQPYGSRTPLFLIHPAGGHLLHFYDLLRYLPLEQPVYGLQAQGLDGSAEPHTRIEEMADYYVSAIRAVQPHGPYYLCGFSLGGIIAFEMARLILEQGDPVWVGVLDTVGGSPAKRVSGERVSLPVTPPRLSPVRMFQSFRRDASKLAGLPGAERRSFFEKRMQELWKSHVVKRFWVLVGKPEQYKRRYQTPESRVIEACRTAIANYSPQPADVRITYFLAEDGDHHQAPDQWRQRARLGVRVVSVQGGHRTMLREPHVGALAQALVAALREAQASRIEQPGEEAGILLS